VALALEAELQFTAGQVAHHVALRFVEEERYWDSVEGDDSPWEAAGSLQPVEGKTRQFVALLIRLGRRAGPRSEARAMILLTSSMASGAPAILSCGLAGRNGRKRAKRSTC
jgi:hypothetical protein